ncbi:hypothetical protein K435DRAFT_794817 [Dendrothele bispora CBS 962.96]|uniref:Uncharacterized protein n=1 Tax=Dendrothele bispora (strain CBS 962.96) TaxID=1314807 RepID=A0A4S8MAR9_DENBC|nr:hypothetical protein K435DRAFT_794817 [Dendrothele bispora CBS 962.96]
MYLKYNSLNFEMFYIHFSATQNENKHSTGNAITNSSSANGNAKKDSGTNSAVSFRTFVVLAGPSMMYRDREVGLGIGRQMILVGLSADPADITIDSDRWNAEDSGRNLRVLSLFCTEGGPLRRRVYLDTKADAFCVPDEEKRVMDLPTRYKHEQSITTLDILWIILIIVQVISLLVVIPVLITQCRVARPTSTTEPSRLLATMIALGTTVADLIVFHSSDHSFRSLPPSVLNGNSTSILQYLGQVISVYTFLVTGNDTGIKPKLMFPLTPGLLVITILSLFLLKVWEVSDVNVLVESPEETSALVPAEESLEEDDNSEPRASGVMEWADFHNCSFGTDKFKLIDVTRHKERGQDGKRTKPRGPGVKLGSHTVKSETAARFLGVLMDEELRWKQQHALMVRRGQAWVTQFRRVAKISEGMMAQFIRQLYKTKAVPRMLYGACVMLAAQSCPRKDGKLVKSSIVSKLTSIQRKAALIITGALHTTATDILDIHAGLLPMPLEVKRQRQRDAAPLFNGLRSTPA